MTSRLEKTFARSGFLAGVVALGLVVGACTPASPIGPTGASTTSSTQPAQGFQPTAPGVSASVPVAATGPGLSPEERSRVVDEVIGHVGAVTGEDHEAAHSEMVAYLQARPEFLDAGVSDDETVWAVFTDGRLFVLLDNRYERDVAAATSADLMAARRSAVGVAMPRTQNASATSRLPMAAVSAKVQMPASTQAVVLNALSAEYGEPTPKIGGWLAAAGYGVVSVDATVDALRQPAVGAGVIFYSGHGGDVTPKVGALAGTKVYALVSTTEISPEKTFEYQEEIEKGLIVLAGAPVATNPDYAAHKNDPECKDPAKRDHTRKCAREIWKGFYAITDLFITEHWNGAVSDGSLVVLDACSSAYLDGVILGLAGVGAFVGWSGQVTPSGSTQLLRLLFDRLLGVNEIPPDAWPELRPVDTASAIEYMRQKASIEDPKTPGTLLTLAQTHPVVLVPSIKSMEVHEDSDELFIEGLFGQRAGEIKMGTTSIDPSNWGPEVVVAKIEDTGPKSAGVVTVVVDGRKSNPVPLTEWRGKVFYSAEYDALAKGLLAEVEFDLHLRADIHMYREHPWEEPTERKVEIRAAGDSKGPWSMHGSGSKQGTKFTLSGSGTLEVEENQPDHDGALFAIFGTLEAVAPGAPPLVKDLVIHAHLSVDPKSSMTIEATGGPAITSGFPLPLSGLLDDVPFEFDKDFRILLGQLEGQIKGGLGPATLYWDDIPSKFPPSLDDPPQA